MTINLRDLQSLLYQPYPTQAEAIKKVADAFNRARLTPRVSGFLRCGFRWQGNPGDFMPRLRLRIQFRNKVVMKVLRERTRLAIWIVALAGVMAIGSGFLHRAVAFSQKGLAADSAPVVLELFTSEGCSSCPPADALLSELGSSTRSVIPLAYHVDYWNHLGWSDPFSSHQWSERQSAYVRAMNLGGDYTPQMVIAGVRQCVGSDRRSIARAIAAERSAAAPGRVGLHTSLDTASSRILRVRVDAQMLSTAETGTLVVMLAIYENGLVSKIAGGENSGRELTYDYTVRKLIPAFEIDSTQDHLVEKELRIDLDRSWSVDHLGVTAFIQDTASLKILGAAAEYPIARE